MFTYVLCTAAVLFNRRENLDILVHLKLRQDPGVPEVCTSPRGEFVLIAKTGLGEELKLNSLGISAIQLRCYQSCQAALYTIVLIIKVLTFMQLHRSGAVGG